MRWILVAGTLYGTIGINPIMITGIICLTYAAAMETFIEIKFKGNKQHKNVFVMVQSDFKESIHYNEDSEIG